MSSVPFSETMLQLLFIKQLVKQLFRLLNDPWWKTLMTSVSVGHIHTSHPIPCPHGVDWWCGPARWGYGVDSSYTALVFFINVHFHLWINSILFIIVLVGILFSGSKQLYGASPATPGKECFSGQLTKKKHINNNNNDNDNYNIKKRKKRVNKMNG